MSDFKQRIFMATIFLSLTLFSAVFTAAQKQTDLTVKEASVAKQPLTSRANEIKVTIANNDKSKADKVTVTVYALPATTYRFKYFMDSAGFESYILAGKITESYKFPDPSFNGNQYFDMTLNFTDKATVEQYFNLAYSNAWAWAQSKQEISLEPNASQTLTISMPAFYTTPPSQYPQSEEQKADRDKINKILKIFPWQSPDSSNPTYFAASPKMLTFQKSVFYIAVKGGADKNEKDNTYFIARQLLQQN